MFKNCFEVFIDVVIVIIMIILVLEFYEFNGDMWEVFVVLGY